MKIQYASDLHLEFRENSCLLRDDPLSVAGEVLVLAGDIGYIGDENYSRHPFWDWASENYREVIVIPGNHEFYKMFDIDKLYNGWSLKIRENITCHYNSVISLDEDTDLIATTLWSKIQRRAFTLSSFFKTGRNAEYGRTYHCRHAPCAVIRVDGCRIQGKSAKRGLYCRAGGLYCRQSD